MPDPTRTHEPAQPAAPTPPPAGKAWPDKGKDIGHHIKDGDLEDSAAGEEDPGSAVDSLVPKH